jgi:hypothetical protein
MRELGIPAWMMAILNVGFFFPLSFSLHSLKLANSKQKIVFKPVEHGALTQLFAGTSPTLTAKENGAYLVPLAYVSTLLFQIYATR